MAFRDTPRYTSSLPPAPQAQRPDRAPPAPAPPAPAPTLGAARARALEHAARAWAASYGTGSQRVLIARAERALLELHTPGSGSTSQASLDAVCHDVERAHRARYGHVALQSELADERVRHAALSSDAALVRYERKWQTELARLQRAHPGRWRVPGLSEDEVRDASTLRLIEVVRTHPELHPRYCRAGRPWGLVLAEAHVRELRRRFRLPATPIDFADLTLPERAPGLEERWLELEAEGLRRLATERAQRTLSRTQRRWFSALENAAQRGEFFASSERPNLSAASRALGKNRSSAQRAYQDLQARFRRELSRCECASAASERAVTAGRK